MSNMNCRGARAGPWLALLFCFLGLLLVLPTTAFAGGSTIWVAPPNGKDDTANIQAALNACVARGPGCTVQLHAGIYHTAQVVVYNFRGTFKGMGMDKTTIEALPNLLVNAVAGCQPNLTTCIWASLFDFVEGNITVSDLTIKFSHVPATQPWVGGDGVTYMQLSEGMGFMGQHPTYVCIDRIRMEGQPDNSSAFNFNVINGIHYSGELPDPTTSGAYFLSGSYTVRSSYLSQLGIAISQDQSVTSSHVTIGGSPSTGNHIENVLGGLDLESSEKSSFEISYNESSGISAGMWVISTWPAGFVTSGPSRYLIHDNVFVGTGQYATGMYIVDDSTNPWIQAAVWNNTMEVQTTPSQGMALVNTKGTGVWNNRITGTDGFDAISLWGSTQDIVINNDVSNFTVDSTLGLAQIFLDSSTTRDLVVCAERNDNVVNQGTNNIIIGCQQPVTANAAATESMAPSVSAPKPNLPKVNKPRLF